ncbi:hypothetical protein V5G24_11960 [Xanthobacter sp. VTT E-85241]|uniref:hypothetical protein n=1 Tax=Roseixanthobacter finlandensis TaxID=3119922 RepID=UPI00372C0DE5
MMSIDADVQHKDGNIVVMTYLSDCVVGFRNNLMSERFDTWSELDINLIFVHYIMGLVVSLFDKSLPETQMNCIQRLAELEIPREEAVRALHVVPPGGQGGLARAVEAAEQAGRHDGGRMKTPSPFLRQSAELGVL